jgi:hypothetical protein
MFLGAHDGFELAANAVVKQRTRLSHPDRQVRAAKVRCTTSSIEKGRRGWS